MTFLIQQTLIYAVPLMIVALAGVFAERSGIINLALEGIMVFGAFIGVWFVRILQTSDAILSLKQSGNWVALQGVELLTMLVAAAFGALFSLLLSFASINLRADQTIGGTALNLMAPALVLFFIRIIANQNTLQMLTGDAASWFMIKKSTLGIDKNTDLGFFGETFVNKVYLATYVCILLFIILSILLYKTRFGLRLRACGENPQAADSLGINVYKMRYAGTTISGALAGMGGFVYALTTANCASNGDVAGFGFLALAVMIFGNWKPVNIAVSSLLFGLFKCIAASYASIDINGDGITELPRPDSSVSDTKQADGMVFWEQYRPDGLATVERTYHCLSGGWYFILPEDWTGDVTALASDAGIGETQVTLSVQGEKALSICALTGENRERRALRGNRVVLRRRTGTIYAAETLSEAYSLDEEALRHNFNLIVHSWDAN